jgi:hypothetical protein
MLVTEGNGRVELGTHSYDTAIRRPGARRRVPRGMRGPGWPGGGLDKRGGGVAGVGVHLRVVHEVESAVAPS